MKCFRYNLNQNNQGPAGILPSDSITGIFVNDAYYGAALIDDLNILSDWNAVEITPLEYNTICAVSPSDENPNPDPALVQLEPAIRQKYSSLMESIVKPYEIQERETWFIQVEEALKWQANNAIDVSEIPLITAISTARNESMSVIVNNIIQKNTEYRTAIVGLLKDRPELKLEDAFYIVKSKIGATRLQEERAELAERKARQKEMALLSARGTRTRPQGQPKFKNALEAYKWHKSQLSR